MRNLEKYIENKKIDYNKLLKYGFKKNNNVYTYLENICNNKFKIVVNLSEEKMYSKLIDLLSDEEYILVDILDSTGEFVGSVRDEYEQKIKEIINSCTISNIFKNSQTKMIIEYVKNKYDDELEFLWEKYDNNAILRNKKNNKWYAIILTISENKLGIDSREKVEIIDLRFQKNNTESVIDNKNIFPGYHMNKKSWITHYLLMKYMITLIIVTIYHLVKKIKKVNYQLKFLII